MFGWCSNSNFLKLECLSIKKMCNTHSLPIGWIRRWFLFQLNQRLPNSRNTPKKLRVTKIESETESLESGKIIFTALNLYFILGVVWVARVFFLLIFSLLDLSSLKLANEKSVERVALRGIGRSEIFYLLEFRGLVGRPTSKV